MRETHRPGAKAAGTEHVKSEQKHVLIFVKFVQTYSFSRAIIIDVNPQYII